MLLGQREHAVEVFDHVAAFGHEGELLVDRLGHVLGHAVVDDLGEHLHAGAARMEGDVVEDHPQLGHGVLRVEGDGVLVHHELLAVRVAGAEERELAAAKAAAHGEEQGGGLHELFAAPGGGDGVEEEPVVHGLGGDVRRGHLLVGAHEGRGDLAEELLFGRFEREPDGFGRGLGGRGFNRSLRRGNRFGGSLRRGCAFGGGRRLRALLRMARLGRCRLGLAHVDGLLRGLLAPLLDGLGRVDELDARTVLLFGASGALASEHRLDALVVAVVVGRGEELAGEAATRDAREVARRRLDGDVLRREPFGEVDRHQMALERLLGHREPAAGRALVEAALAVLGRELQTHLGRVRIVEEQLHEAAQRNRAVAGLHLVGDDGERLLVGQEADLEGQRFARRGLAPAEVAVAEIAARRPVGGRLGPRGGDARASGGHGRTGHAGRGGVAEAAARIVAARGAAGGGTSEAISEAAFATIAEIAAAFVAPCAEIASAAAPRSGVARTAFVVERILLNVPGGIAVGRLLRPVGSQCKAVKEDGLVLFVAHYEPRAQPHTAFKHRNSSAFVQEGQERVALIFA